MDQFTLANPVFVTYAIAASIMVLKIMLQGWITVARMIKNDAGLVNPEDIKPGPANRNPRPEQLQPLEDVDRSRRIHRNDLENIPAFLAIGLIFVAIAPPLAAQWLMYGFVAARLLHTIVYSTAQRHEVRAVFYSVGSLIVIAMAIWVLLVAISAAS
ncbi:MAPEG family protein [Terricaulis silvestris]|uniref:Microsomal glutathione S-transferase 1 n=1 Tax=Terricaulis silvestris TaxID=2686094 RepID=A0A6I6MLX2_9CAUL|nr:MAPEG family protein [Terricaulis silvestris]QGZ94226.1 putative relative of glutathione S-transferase, MAPEG superfamily [Terricaulis silvestris]